MHQSQSFSRIGKDMPKLKRSVSNQTSTEITWKNEITSAGDSLIKANQELLNNKCQCISYYYNMTEAAYFSYNEYSNSKSSDFSESESQEPMNTQGANLKVIDYCYKAFNDGNMMMDERLVKMEEENIKMAAFLEKMKDGEKQTFDLVNSLREKNINNMAETTRMDERLTFYMNYLNKLEESAEIKRRICRQKFCESVEK